MLLSQCKTLKTVSVIVISDFGQAHRYASCSCTCVCRHKKFCQVVQRIHIPRALKDNYNLYRWYAFDRGEMLRDCTPSFNFKNEMTMNFQFHIIYNKSLGNRRDCNTAPCSLYIEIIVKCPTTHDVTSADKAAKNRKSFGNCFSCFWT